MTTTATAFTAGPWAVEYREGMAAHQYGHCVHANNYSQPGVTSGRDSVAEVRGESDEQARANARLIAAAPEMLEALKWIAEMVGYATYELKPEWRSKNGGDFDDALEQARAAIAKAQGR